MRDYKASEIRNVAVLGHSGAGKTALLESMLFYTKASERFGHTGDGSSLIDYDAEEIKRNMSIYTSVVPVEWQDYKINFLDTPGYLDYVGEAEAASAVCDNALIVVDAKEETIQAGTINAWERSQASKKPTIFFINKLDVEDTSFDKTYQALREQFGKAVIPFEIPLLENGEMIGSINILRDKVWYFKGDKASREVSYDIPDNYKDIVSQYRSEISEAVAMGDDELMEKYFSGEEFSEAQLTRGVRIGVRNGEIVPVFSGEATNSVGIERLMDLIIKYFPTYGEQGNVTVLDTKTDDYVELKASEEEVMTSRIFKTVIDPFVGRISFLKIRSGVLSSESVVYNTKKGEQEKIGTIFNVRGKQQVAIGKLFTGDIGAVTKLQYSQTNDTLCEKGKHYLIEDINFSKGILGKSVAPKTKADEDKMNGAIQRVLEEDKTIYLENNPETKQTILYGMGEQHLEVITNKLKSRYKVEVSLNKPKIPYHETIKKTVQTEGRHKKQTGGHGQFADVIIEFSPNPDSEVMKFEEKVVGGAVPKGYFPAVETGLREMMVAGVLAGYRVVNVKATLLDGKYHDVDSSEMAFKMAAHLAFREAMPKANPVLLEPIMHLMITVPEAFTGAIIGDMNKRRGMIMGMDPLGDKQVINCQVPQSEILDLPTELRAITQGRGTYLQEFDHYEEVPNQLADKIIAKAKKDNEA